MKIFLKILLILILVVIVAIGGVVGYTIYSIKDSTDNTPDTIKNNNYPAEKIINREVAQSLNEESEDIEFSFDGYTINEFLYATLTSLKLDSVKFLGCYTDFDDDNFVNIQVPLSFYGVRTSLNANVKITEEEDDFKMEINSGSVGKFSLSSSYLKTILKSVLKEKDIENQLLNVGLDTTINLSTYTLTVTKDSLISKIADATKNDKNASLYRLLINLCVQKPELFQLHLCENKRIGFTIKSSNMKYDASRDGNFSTSINYDYCVNLVNQDIQSGKIDYTNVAAAFEYQVVGYDNLTDSEKEKVDALGYNDTYMGQVHYTSNSMTSYIKDQQPSLIALAEAIESKSLSLNITEEEFNELFAAMNFVGKSYGFCDDEKVGYFSVEALYIRIYENAFDLSIVLNANGRQLVVYAKLDAPKNNDLKIDATIKELRIGDTIIEESYYPDLLDYLSTAMSSTDWIIVNQDTNTITIDLEAAIASGLDFKGKGNLITSKSLEFTSDKKLKITYNF